MDNIFRTSRQYNFWDNLFVNVQEIYEKYPLGEISTTETKTNILTTSFRQLYKNPLLMLSLRRFIRKLAYQTHLDVGWFHDFSWYWSAVLGGRPLWGVQDFYFLMNLYRVRFQDNQIPDTSDPMLHLEAWQRPELLYQLLHLVYKETIVDYASLIKEVFSHKRQVQTFLEFGCGTAPITASLFEFFGSRTDMKIFFSDIQTVAFHYAACRFARHGNAIPLMLTPEYDFKLPDIGPVDVITCITVFEHLNKPLEVVQDFHSLLTPGGLLLFDYIKSDGGGMDTLQSAKERDTVLDFVTTHFEILKGNPSKNESAGLVFARKR